MRPGIDEYGQSPLAEAQNDIRALIGELQRSLAEDEQRDPRDYAPQWSEQRYRCVVPCAKADQYEWVRTGKVATVGELAMELGKLTVWCC